MSRNRGTILLIVAIAIAFGIEVATNSVGNDEALLKLGALPDNGQLQREFWRIATYSFLHFNSLHLLLNVGLLLWIGRIVERQIGTGQGALIYFISVVSSAIAILLVHYFHPKFGATVGASGGVFGLLGASLVISYRRNKNPQLRMWLCIVLLAGFAISFLPDISMAGHIGGIIAGVPLALLVKPRPNGIDGCNALITGASAGIGREFARQLAARARTLVLVARREQRLIELRDELRNRNARLQVHTRMVDLCDKSQIDELVRWLKENKIEIDFLINNAGLGDYGSVATSDVERDDRMIHVNIAALTFLTHQLLPRLIARKRGAILNVSSSAGFLPIPGMALYAASKAYVNSFTEALRAELRGSGVVVTALCPGPVHTEFGDVAKRPGGQPETGPEFVYVSVEKTVRDALAAVESDKPLVIPGFFMKLGMFLVRITPMSILRLAWRLGAKRGTHRSCKRSATV